MRLRAILAILALSSPSWATEPLGEPEPTPAPEEPACVSTDTQVCVDKEDLKKFLQLAQERKCLDETKPDFQLDPIIIITDEEGRVFYTGNDPKKPYKLSMEWCHYKAEAEGDVKVVAAMNEPETWGFRFRPKAYLGYLPLKPLLKDDVKFSEGIDAGLMLDFFYVQWVNVNITAGFRSTGVGVGFDLTKNFGVETGYVFSWSEPMGHSALGSIYFAF